MAPNDNQPDPKTIATWNTALKTENCFLVRRLLRKSRGLCPGAVELLKEGWKEVDLVQQSGKAKPASVCKGRTALHVAARRGDVKLVKDILDIWYPLISEASMASNEEGRKDPDPLVSRASMASKEQGPIGSDPLIPELLESIKRLTDVFNTRLGTSMASKEQVGRAPTDLKNLLEVIDDDYELDALGMAVVNGNKQIANLLRNASEWNPSNVRPDAIERSGDSDEAEKARLSEVIKEVLCEISQSSTETNENTRYIIQLYKDDCDFNFIHEDVDVKLDFIHEDVDVLLDKLDMHLFFHFTFSTWTMEEEYEADTMWDIQKQIISRAKVDKLLLKFLLVTLKDGQGRTALHVAVDSQKVRAFLEATEQLGKGDDSKEYLNVRDSANRTPLYRAAAKEQSQAVRELLKDKRTNVHAIIKYKTDDWGTGLDIDKLSWKNGFRSDCVYIPLEKLTSKGFNNEDNSQAGPGPDIDPVEEISSTALHVAIIHKHEYIVEIILEEIFKRLGALLPSRHFEVYKGLGPLLENGHYETCNGDCKDDHCRLLGPLLKNGHFETCCTDCKDDHFTNNSPDCSSWYICNRDCKYDHSADSSPHCTRRFSWPILTATQGDEKTQRSEVTTLQLTVLVGSIPILRQLLQAEENFKKASYYSGDKEKSWKNFLLAAAIGNLGAIKAFCFPWLEEEPKKLTYFSGGKKRSWRNFLLAAAMGNPGVVKMFLDSKQGKFDYDIRDPFENTALHHALKGKHVQFYPHMLDFVGCHHVYSSRWNNDVWKSRWLANPLDTTRVQRDVENDNKEDLDLGRYGQRRGSINLLLEAGIDIWAKNGHQRTASPDPDAPKDFVEWWYEKVATETKEEQTKLSDAANAISVVAALVATASYLGPLQPPLGYNGDSLQVNVSAVRIFVICNSLSFYLALAAIMWALLPSLPLQKESMFTELERTRIVVAFAVSCLFPSIICVLVAFAASYIAVIPDHGLSHHGLIVSTTVVGGFVCLYVMFFWFLGRLLKVLKDRLKEPLLDPLGKFLKESLKGPLLDRPLKCLRDGLEGSMKFLKDILTKGRSLPEPQTKDKAHLKWVAVGVD